MSLEFRSLETDVQGVDPIRTIGTLAAALIASCGTDVDPESERGPASAWPFDLPPGFPAPKNPKSNPVTAEKAELGRHLFYDVRLSQNRTQSCASCHEQARAFSEPRAVSVGSTGEAHVRNAGALVNVAYNGTLNWADPGLTRLEDQIPGPLFGEAPVELGATDSVLERLAADDRYRRLFDEAFPEVPEDSRVTWDRVIGALATFCRTLISGRSPFDRYTYGDDPNALSPAARRGLRLFFSERLECFHCHGGFNFTQSSVHSDTPFEASFFHNTGLYDVDGRGGYPDVDRGVYDATGRPTDMGRFRAPTLRNVEVSGPYAHDGSVGTLEEVIANYERGGRRVATGPWAGDGADNPFKSGFVSGFSLTDSERADLLAFLRSLTDESFLSDPRFSDPWSEDP